ncbi:MAG TPA: hypothetical protein VEA16_16890 [Vicinamibacterales bacterium]|nr:hypothetical protein [Vicinamibacterales bacterium]
MTTRGGINGKVSGRELRRHLKANNQTLDAALPVLEELLHNQDVTRDKLTALEQWRERGFWGRLRWLVTGR